MTGAALSADPAADAIARAERRRASAGFITQPPAKSGGRPTAPSWREARTALGLSLREVEERTGINRGVISMIERGIGPRIDHARRLLAVYDEAGS